MIKLEKLRIWRQQEGFTLIEAVISIALLAIIAVAILTGVSTSLMSSARADRQSNAMSLAIRQMESLQLQPYETADPGGEVTYPTIVSIPSNFSIWSYNRSGVPVDYVVGVPWYSDHDVTDGTDEGGMLDVDGGLQKIILVIKQSDNIALEIETYKVK